MAGKKTYWHGARPSGGKRWQGADSGIVLDLEKHGEALFRMYRRYVRQWNDIELDHTRELSEHTFRVCGPRVVGSSGGFVLIFDEDRETGWILDLSFSRGFHKFYPGFSTGLNTLRSKTDISRAVLHWRGSGREEFDAWLERERSENSGKGEWAEYKA
ncbi:hypothetical protein [Rhodanobacter glycinis]|uniref:hypothetical protein n=1 Tax=Rhodanobacter glycinis TaxID=582702 RepID=UPI001127439B|nr:hypothetical protein [Rhodanobacter glycinis]